MEGGSALTRLASDKKSMGGEEVLTARKGKKGRQGKRVGGNGARHF
jgi:hypothetical protein